jgi:hypothetical protein
MGRVPADSQNGAASKLQKEIYCGFAWLSPAQVRQYSLYQMG